MNITENRPMNKKLMVALVGIAASSSTAFAGGIDYQAPNTGILFEEGTYVELSYTMASPDVSGTINPPGPPLDSGNMAGDYGFGSIRYRQDITDSLSIAVIYDQPYGAQVDYPATPGYPFANSTAELTSDQITAILKYDIDDNFSVYGGLRALRLAGEAYVSTPAFSYVVDAESDAEFGFLLGAAYERPEIALRVALTYFSGIETQLDGVETPGLPGTPESALLAAAQPTDFTVELPQSILLEAQTGIAEDTLLFGSLRWSDYAGFDITPNNYPAGSLVDYDNDVFTWSLGVGRRINDDLSVALSLGYEAEQDGFSGNLGPTDGVLSVGLGAEYEIGQVTIGGGVQYSWIGDAETRLGGGLTADFHENSAWALGLRVGYSF